MRANREQGDHGTENASSCNGIEWGETWSLGTELEETRERLTSAESERDAANERAERLQGELQSAKDLINLDRTGLASGLNAVKRLLQGWWWIPEGEWGSYDYTQRTEATLRAEFRSMFEQTVAIIDKALKESGKRADAVVRSEPYIRTEMEQQLAELQSSRDALDAERDALAERVAGLEVELTQERVWCNNARVTVSAQLKRLAKLEPVVEAAKALAEACLQYEKTGNSRMAKNCQDALIRAVDALAAETGKEGTGENDKA